MMTWCEKICLYLTIYAIINIGMLFQGYDHYGGADTTTVCAIAIIFSICLLIGVSNVCILKMIFIRFISWNHFDKLFHVDFCRTTNSFWPFVYGSCLRLSFLASFWPLRRSSTKTTKQDPFYWLRFCSNSMFWFVPIPTWKPLEAREHIRNI